MSFFRSLSALLVGAAVVAGVGADEPKKEKPRTDPAFPDIEELLKKLPQNLDPKQVEEIKKALEMAREAQKRALQGANESTQKALEEARKALEEARKVLP